MIKDQSGDKEEILCRVRVTEKRQKCWYLVVCVCGKGGPGVIAGPWKAAQELRRGYSHESSHSDTTDSNPSVPRWRVIGRREGRLKRDSSRDKAAINPSPQSTRRASVGSVE